MCHILPIFGGGWTTAHFAPLPGSAPDGAHRTHVKEITILGESKSESESILRSRSRSLSRSRWNLVDSPTLVMTTYECVNRFVSRQYSSRLSRLFFAKSTSHFMTMCKTYVLSLWNIFWCNIRDKRAWAALPHGRHHTRKSSVLEKLQFEYFIKITARRLTGK